MIVSLSIVTLLSLLTIYNGRIHLPWSERMFIEQSSIFQAIDVKIFIKPFLLYNFNIYVSFKGSVWTPHQLPFTKIFVYLYNSIKFICSKGNILSSLRHLIKGSDLHPKLIIVNIDKFLCNPIFPPSGVSTGQINPQEEECSLRGSIIFAERDKGKFVLLICEIVPKFDNLFKSWTIPCLSLLLPQLPFKAFLNPFSISRKSKILSLLILTILV